MDATTLSSGHEPARAFCYPAALRSELTLRSLPRNSEPCLVCGSSAFEPYRTRSDGGLVVICDRCGMGVVAEVPSDLDAYYGDDYYASGQENTVTGYGDYAALAEHSVAWAAALVRLLTKPGRILDIGSADGHFLKKLMPEYECFGIEVNAKMADQSRAHGVEVIASDIFDPHLLANHAGSYDVVSALAVFEHTRDIRRAVEIAAALLTPDGLLIFEVPLVKGSVDDGMWFRTSLEHVWYPTERGIEYLFDSLGLPLVGKEQEIVDFASTFVGIVSRSDARSSIENRFGELTSGSSTTDQRQARFRALFDLVHSGKVDASTIALLPALSPEDLNPLMLDRLTALWAGHETKRQQVVAAHTAAVTESETKVGSLEHEAAEAAHEAVALGLRIQELDTMLCASETKVGSLEHEAAEAAHEAVALGLRIQELDAMLHAIENSRAYRVGLAARGAKLATNAPLAAARRMWRAAQRRTRRAYAHASIPGQSFEGPTVSVIMPVYDKGPTLLDSVNSVRGQTLTSWELIVWDDGSTDPKTIEVLDQLDGVGIRVFRTENRGVIAARNADARDTLARGQ